MEALEDLSKKIKSRRKSKNLSQAAYSQELGVAKSTLQKLERGESVSMSTMQHVAEQIGATLSIGVQARPEDYAHAREAVGGMMKDLQFFFCLPAGERMQMISAAKAILEILEERWM